MSEKKTLPIYLRACVSVCLCVCLCGAWGKEVHHRALVEIRAQLWKLILFLQSGQTQFVKPGGKHP